MAIKTLGIADGDRRQIDRFDVLIFTAIEDLEAERLSRHLIRVDAKPVPPTEAERSLGLERWRVPSAKSPDQPLEIITKCLKRAGNAASSIELAQIFFTQTRCRLVVFCGIGGSLDPKDYPLGQVVVSKSVQWRGFDKISGDKLSREMRKKVLDDKAVNSNLLNVIDAYCKDELAAKKPTAVGLIDTGSKDFRRRIMDWVKQTAKIKELEEDLDGFEADQYFDQKKPMVKQGKVVSWDYVLNQKEVREELKKIDTDFAVVEMEGGGLSMVSRRAWEHFGDIEPVVLSIRGISDLCNVKVDDVFRELAADHAAAFLTGFLANGYTPDF